MIGLLGAARRNDGYASRSRAGFADDAIAALADAAGAATALAGLLHGRGRAVVVNRKPFSKFHLNILCFVRM